MVMPSDVISALALPFTRLAVLLRNFIGCCLPFLKLSQLLPFLMKEV